MAQGFQRNVGRVDPATYVKQGVASEPDQSMSILLGGAEAIGGAVKQGYGTGLGEKIMDDTLDEFLSVPASSQASTTQSIGLDGTVRQYDEGGQSLGASGQIDPNLAGAQRDAAIRESTAEFNTKSNKVKRAYEAGLIDDRELRARMSLNLRQAEEKYPAFKQEIAQQANRMLTDDLYYYHYTSAISGIEAMRQQREQEAQDAAKLDAKLREAMAMDAWEKFGIDPRLGMQNPDQIQQVMQQQKAFEVEQERLDAIQKAEDRSEKVNTRMARSQAAIYRNTALHQSKSVMMDTLGVTDPSQLTLAVGGAKPAQLAVTRDKLIQQRDRQVQQFLSDHPNITGADRDRLVNRIKSPFDDSLEALENPRLLTMMDNAQNTRIAEFESHMPDSLLKTGIIMDMFKDMPPPVINAVLAGIDTSEDVRTAIQYISGDDNYNPDADNQTDPETVGQGQQLLDNGINNLTNNKGEYPEGARQTNDLHDFVNNMFHRTVTKTAHHLEQGEDAAFDNVLSNVDTIIRTARTNPELLASMDDEVRSTARNNVQQLVQSASGQIDQWLGEDGLSALSVDPNTGLLKSAGATGARVPEQSRTMLSIGRGQAPVAQADVFLNNMNRAIKAQAALSGDMSTSNVRQISARMLEEFNMQGGDEQSIKNHISQLAPAYGLEPEFALSVARQESRFDPKAESPAGAVGVMQLMPATAQELGVSPDERTNPTKNIPAGLQYLGQQMERAKYLDPSIKPMEQKAVALAMYNAGPGATTQFLRGDRDSMPKETTDYINIILGGKKDSTYDKLLLNVRARVMNPAGDNEEG